MLAPWKESYDKTRQCVTKQKHHFANKCPSSQSYDFFSVVMYRCKSWTIKRPNTEELMFQIMALEKTLESPLDSKEIKPVNPKGNQP